MTRRIGSFAGLLALLAAAPATRAGDCPEAVVPAPRFQLLSGESIVPSGTAVHFRVVDGDCNGSHVVPLGGRSPAIEVGTAAGGPFAPAAIKGRRGNYWWIPPGPGTFFLRVTVPPAPHRDLDDASQPLREARLVLLVVPPDTPSTSLVLAKGLSCSLDAGRMMLVEASLPGTDGWPAPAMALPWPMAAPVGAPLPPGRYAIGAGLERWEDELSSIRPRRVIPGRYLEQIVRARFASVTVAAKGGPAVLGACPAAD